MESSHEALVAVGKMMEGVPSHLKPGMSHSIQAGEKLTIRDQNGDEISVQAHEHDKTMAFLRAYDELQSARLKGLTGVASQALERAVEVSFNNLPNHVLRELPSFKALAIRLGG